MTTHDEREQNAAEILINFMFEFCENTQDTYRGPKKVGNTISFFVKDIDCVIPIGDIGEFCINIDNNNAGPNNTFDLYIHPLKLKSAITNYRPSKKKDALISAFNTIVDETFDYISQVFVNTIKRVFYCNTEKFTSGIVCFWANDIYIATDKPWVNRDNFAEEFDMYNELHQRIYEIDQWIIGHMKGET